MADLEKLLGIKGCTVKNRKDKIEKISDEFLETVEDTFNDIASKVYGPFLPTVFALASQLGVGASLDYATFLGKMVTQNVMGGFIGAVGLSLATLNGSKTLLKYAAAKSLQESLERRKELSLALLSQVQGLLRLLQSFRDIDIKADEALLGEIQEVLLEVKRAMLIVSRESSKIDRTNSAAIQFTQNPVSPRKLERAVDHIDRALVLLGGSQLSKDLYDEKLKRLNKKYSLEVVPRTKFTDSVGVANPIGIARYFKESYNQIKKENSLNGELTEKGQIILRNYIIDFINTPGINEFFKTFAAAGLLGDYISTIGKKLPIRSSVSAHFAKQGAKEMWRAGVESIEDKNETAKEIQDNIFSYLQLQPYGTTLQFPDDETTLKLSGVEVATSQLSILLINERFDSLQAQVKGLKNFLTPAYNNLDDVKRGLEDTIQRDEIAQDASGIASLASQKIQWMSKLSLSKTLISGGIETPAYLGPGKVPVSSYDINKRFVESDVIYRELQGMIRSRLVDENGEEIPTQSEQILKVANSTLSSFALGPLTLFNPKARDSAIGGLQSIKRLLREQISQDSLELTKVTVYINSVEANPLFSSVLKPAWDEMLDRIAASGMGKTVSENLSRGNLSTLLNALEAGRFAKDNVQELFECGEEPVGPEDRKRREYMGNVFGIDIEKTQKLMKQVESQMSGLINRGKMLKILKDSV